MMASLKPSQINGAKTKWGDKVGGIPHKVGGQSGPGLGSNVAREGDSNAGMPTIIVMLQDAMDGGEI